MARPTLLIDSDRFWAVIFPSWAPVARVALGGAAAVPASGTGAAPAPERLQA